MTRMTPGQTSNPFDEGFGLAATGAAPAGAPPATARPIRPVPQVTVEGFGVVLAPADRRALVGVRVTQRLSLPAACELTFAEPDGGLTPAGQAGLSPGASLRVTVEGHDTPLFEGEVTANEFVYGATGGRELRVRGYDRLHRLRKRQAVKAREQVTAGDVAGELARDVGLSAAVAEAGPAWQRVVQHRQSDLELLTELADRAGLYFAVWDGVLHLTTLDGVGAGDPVPLGLGTTLLEARIEVNGDPACREVSAAGWDPARVEAHAGRAGPPRVGRDVYAEVPPDRVGGTGARTLVAETVQTVEQADAAAQADLDRRAAGEVVLWGVAEGDPRLRPGARVDVSGVADTVAGRYVLTGVTHTIDGRRGFISEVSSAPPVPPPRPAGTVMALGVVSRIDDPENLGRVRVSLPAYDDVETDWMGVVAAGAGGKKGIVSLPDRDDRVLVLFARGDPAQGVVVGGLWGAGGPPDTGIDGGAVRRYTLTTPGGQRVRLDDVNKSVRLENSDGSYVELSESEVRLHAGRDLVIEAPGRAVVIRGKTVDFKKG